jgi:hypothetical protein
MDSLNVALTIKPETDGATVTIYNQAGGNFKLPVSRSLTLENLIIDSLDSIATPVSETAFGNDYSSDFSQAYDSCWSNRETCCEVTENDAWEVTCVDDTLDWTANNVLTENCHMSKGTSMIYFMNTFKS